MQLTVSPERLLERSTQCANKAEEMETTITNMTAIMNELSSEWLGSASEAFQNQYAELLPSFNSMRELIEQLSQQLSQISRNYTDLETQTVGQLGSR